MFVYIFAFKVEFALWQKKKRSRVLITYFLKHPRKKELWCNAEELILRQFETLISFDIQSVCFEKYKNQK